MRPLRVIQVATAVLAVALLGLGLWAMVSPHGFYASAATYPPYNEHFIRDIGSLVIGLAGGLVAGLVFRDALLAVLTGSAVAFTAHLAAHVVDRSDPLTFAVPAALVVALATWRAAMLRHAR